MCIGHCIVFDEALHSVVVYIPFFLENISFNYVLRMHSATRKATGPENESALLGNREFSYRELKYITSNFSQEIGKGGFGPVFFGYLENGNAVAVKVHSDSSSQGGKEFLAEVKKKFQFEVISVAILIFMLFFLSSIFALNPCVTICFSFFMNDHFQVCLVVL